MKAKRSKALVAALAIALAVSWTLPAASALTVADAITSIQSSNPTLPTGVSNPKGNIGFLLANMFWNSADVGYDSTKFGKIKPQYFDGAGATAWTYAGGNTYMTDMNGRVGIGTNDPQAYLHLKSHLADHSAALLLESPSTGSSSPRIALVDTSSGSVTAEPAWLLDNAFDRFRIFRQPNITNAGSVHFAISSSGNTSVGNSLSNFVPSATFEVRNTSANPNYAAWVEGGNAANYGLGVNIANSTSSRGIANFKSNNVSRFFVRADGNVGIGTTNPDSALDVNGDISAYTRFRYTSVDSDYFWLRSRLGTEPNALSIGIGSDEATGTTKDIRMLTNGVGRFYIAQDGKIGMGTFNPTATLDVVGEAKAVNGTFTDNMSQSLTQGALKLSWTNGAVVIDDAGQKRLSWNDAGGNLNLRGGNYYQSGVGIVYAKGASDANGGAATITLNSDIADGAVTLNAAPIGTPGSPVTYTNYLNVNATNSYFGGGNVGIWTTTPSAKLEVSGQVKITGGSPGAGKVLTSDATGLATWVSPSSYTESDPKVATTANGYLSKWNGSSLVDSNVFSDGTNVGIWTATPSSALTVNGDVSSRRLFLSGWSGTDIVKIQPSDDANPNYNALTIGNAAWTNWPIQLRKNGDSYFAGNMGIGTASPTQKLDVAGISASYAFRAGQGVPNGSDSSTVGYAFGVDGDTGLFSPVVTAWANNGVMAFYGNNVEIMRMLPSLSVGIGTTNPAASFEVKRSIADSNYAAWIEGTNSWNFGLGVNIANTTTTKAIADFRSANISRLHIRADGNVGVGTTTPTTRFNVVGSSNFSRDNASECCSSNDYTVAISELTNSTGKMSSIQFHNSGVAEGYFRLANGGARRFQIGDNQGVTAGLQMSGNLQVDGTGNSYVAGNLGIGTSSPGTKLEVAGQVKITGGSPGAGKVLTSDASGLATWTTPSSGTAHSTRIVSNNAAWTSFVAASCNSSTEVVTGWSCVSNNNSIISQGYPTASGWYCQSQSDIFYSVTAYAVCLAK